MKKLLIVTIALLVIIGGSLSVLSFSQREDFNVYEVMDQITYDQVFDLGEGNHVVYYYSETCSHCIDFKPTIADYYEKISQNDNAFIHGVDVGLETNQGVSVSQNDPLYTTDVSVMNENQAVYIYGTPSAVLVKDGVVTDFALGGPQITQLLNKALTN